MKKFLYRRIEERKELLFRSNFLFLPAAIGLFLFPYLLFFSHFLPKETMDLRLFF